MRIERELLRGAGPVTVLRLLSRREMYGYELVETLDQRTDGVLAMGHSTLYPLLYSLERKGLVRSTNRTAPSGRHRKYYAVTAKGTAYLKAHQSEWRRLVSALTGLGVLSARRAESS
ncbi:MAG: PadR family transcriptional regulator [Gemmatimonadota bacterium]